MNDDFSNLIDAFRRRPEVGALLLAGSRVRGDHDEHSDYDVYVYTAAALSVETRKAITDRYCSYMELNNQFWETEDDGVLNNGVAIELIYRSFDWLEGELTRVVFEHQAGCGYTTCMWANLLSSRILHDPEGRATHMQQRFTVPYPEGLKQNIVAKNYPLLKEKTPAYYHQIEKALKRHDHVSVNHRVAEFLASYFDILFAVNERPHPGEKRMLAYALKSCDRLPRQLETHIDELLGGIGSSNGNLLSTIDDMVSELDRVL